MANLLEKASIILTPTAYDDGKVLAIKPSEAPYGDFDFTRNSSATRVNAQGLVEDVQILSSNLVQNGDFSQIGSEEVTNGNFSQEGSELVTNGDFATDSDWAKNPNWTISGGTANCDGTSDGSFFQGSVIQDSKQYLVTYTISNLTQGGLRVQLSGTQGVLRTLNGTYTEYITSGLNPSGRVSFDCSSSPIGSIDNVSVKEVGQDWTLGTGWSIGEDKAIAVSGASTRLEQSISGLSGKTCKVSFTLSDYGGSGSVYVDFGSVNSDLINTNGIHIVYGTFDQDEFELFKGAAFNGSITNISVKEVGQNWTLYAGWSIGENKVVGDGTAFTDVAQAPILIQNKKIKLTFDVLDYVSGTFRIRPSDRQDGLDERFSGNGSYEVIYTSTTDYFRFQQQALVGSITNISILEITDDTNLPRINYSGFTYQDSLGSEEIVNGDFSNGTNNWTPNANATLNIDNDKLKVTISGTSGYPSQFITTEIGKTYKVTADAFIGTSSRLALYNDADSQFRNLYADGSFDFTITATSTSTQLRLYVFDNGSYGLWDNVSVKEYLGQEVVPDSGCGAWLFEPQSTNIITQSEDFSQWIIQDSATVSSATFVSPSGENNASLIDLSANTDARVVLNFGNSSTEYTFSVYLKKHESDSNGTFPLAYYDGSNYIKTYVNLTDKWERFNLTFTNPSGSTFGYGLSRKGTTNDETLTRCYAWGGQFEAQSYATSYIPTEGTIKTRNQDLCTNGGDVSLINSTEGVLYAEISALADDLTNREITINDGSTQNYVMIRYNNNQSNWIYTRVNLGGTYEYFNINSNNVITDYNKIAIRYQDNNFATFINGTKVYSQLSGSAFGANVLNDISFDGGVGNSIFYGNTKALGVWKEALTDAELRSLTYPTPTAATFDLDFNTIATDFTFTRNSEATFVNAQGLIQSTNELGSEEIVNGSFDVNGNWSNFGTPLVSEQSSARYYTSPFSWYVNGDAFRQGIFSPNNFTLTNGKTYNVSLWVYALDGAEILSGLTNTDKSVFTSHAVTQNEWTNITYSAIANATSASYISILTSSSTLEFYIDNVSVKEYITETNTPRLDYSTGAEAFLLEPQRTNLIPYSEDFTVWNQIQNVNLISNSTISPSGENNATKFLSTTGSSKVRNNFSSVSGTTYTFSVYCKNIDATFVRLLAYDGANEFSAYVVSQINTSTWTKVSLTFTAANTSNSAQVQIARDLPDGQSLYFWGAQLEGSSYATSYIPTSGTTVTRNQELCNNATPVINSEEGVLYAEIAALSNDVTNRAISISDGTTSNVVRFYYSTTDNRIVGNVKSEGITSFTFNNVLSNATNFLKIAISYKLNNFKMYVNGIEVASDTVGNAPIGLSELSFDNGVGNDKFFGNTKGLKICPKALADVELQDLTTI